MKRVLFITNIPSPYRVDFFDALGQFMDVTVLYFDRRQDHSDRTKEWYIQGKGNFHPVQLEKRIASVGGENLCVDVIDWVKKPFDHIVVCGYSSPTVMLAMAYMGLHKIPYYMEVDGGLIRQDSRPKYLFKRTLVSGASGWISSGKETTRYLTHYGAKPDKVYHYPFTSLWEKDILPEAPSAEEKIRLRQQLGMTEEKILLYVGRYDPKKGMEDLLHGVPGLDKNIGVYFIGGEPEESHLAFCRDNAVANAHFVGFKKKEELALYYRAADALVLPTWSDVWGLVINEAMACGLPVVTTDKCVAGMELVEPGVTGYIVPIQAPQALTDACNRILNEDYRAMGRAALETIRPYTIENMAKAHVDIFTKQER